MIVPVALSGFLGCFFHVLGWMNEGRGACLLAPLSCLFFPAVPFVTPSSVGTVSATSFDLVGP